ncbi:MAG: response regulator [Planctomycetaceae bacterium]
MSHTLTQVIVTRILVVEDDRDEAEFLKKFLGEHGYEVQVARDAGQAHSAFIMNPPDFVLLDAILPNDVSGFEVCDRMKQSHAETPIVFLSGIELEDARDLALRVGADGYLLKPYDPNELLVMIRETADRVWQQVHLNADEAKSERVRFDCGECGRKLKVKGSHRGQRMNCPQCGASLTVPRRD